MNSRHYWIERAIARKVLREGTGLAVDQMTDEALVKRLAVQLEAAWSAILAADGANVPLARALWEIRAIWLETQHRGAQLALFDDCHDSGKYVATAELAGYVD